MQDQLAQGFRLSPQQQRLWLLEGGEPGAAFRCRCLLRLEGDVDPYNLEQALRQVIARNEILRTSFLVLPGMSLPLQVIRDPEPRLLKRLDLGALSPSERDTRLAEVYEAAGRVPFGLQDGEVLRATLLEAGTEKFLILDLPALCADPAALENLAGEISQAYSQEGPVGEPMQYADLAEWQNEYFELKDTAEGVDEWERLWRERELSAQLSWRLPLEDAAGTSRELEPTAVPVPLKPEVGSALRELAARWSCSTATLCLTAWQIVLWRSSGREDVLVGALQHGRRYDELQAALGPLARYVPVHIRLSEGMLPREVLELTRVALEEAARRQELFSWQHAAGPGAGAGFFPVCFSCQDSWRSTTGRLTLSPLRIDAVVDRFKIELACTLTPEQTRLELRYDRGLFRPGHAAFLAERLGALLASLAARPDTPVGEQDILGEAERLQVLAFAAGPGSAAPSGCFHRRFEEQARRAPDHPAVVYDGQRLTFAELNGRANQLARHLRDLGVGPEVLVALCLERSTAQVEAVLAVLKAGGAYLPIDPSQPAEHLGFLLDDSGVHLVVTEARLAAGLPVGEARPAVRAVLLDAEAEAIGAHSDADLEDGASPGNLAYAIYTSGSTGRPKGVLVEHRSPLNLLAGLEAAILARHGTSPLAVSLNAPLFFDASMQQLCLLLRGHTLHVVPEAVRVDGPALLSFLDKEEIDLFDCTPTQLRILVAAGLLDATGQVPGIVLTAGEAIDELLWQSLRVSRRTTFYNIYGPTECTVDATAHRIGPDSEAPTIGRPLAGYAAFVLDRGLRPVPLGAPGELFLGGAGVTRGYLGRPDLTAERFVPHPFGPSGGRLYRTGDLARQLLNGDLEFLGRADRQLKIRGYRIEPGEIEAALVTHPWVGEAVVTARQMTPDQPPMLVAYVLPAGEAPTGFASSNGPLHEHLRERLPAYMVPAAFVALGQFPLTPSGKIDHRALPDPDPLRLADNTTYVAPRSQVEQALADVWAEVLRTERVGIDDSFFSNGGDSIRSLQVQALAHRRGLHFSVQQLFQRPTIRELAEVVRTEESPAAQLPSQPFGLVSEADRARLPEGVEDAYPMTLLQTGMLFQTELRPESGLYQDIRSFSVRARLDLPLLEAVLARLVERHSLLRTGFHLSGFSEPLQLVHRTAHVPVEVHDLRGLAEDEQERTIGELLESEKVRPFDWRQPPLVRIALHLRNEECFQLTLTEHHSLFDGWSVASLLTELFNLYVRGPEALATAEPPPPPAFRDYVGLERQALASEEARAYWQRVLAGASWGQLPRWPDAPQGGAALRSERVLLQLPDALSEDLRELARRISVPLKSVLLAIHLRVIATLTGNADVVTGISSDGRPEAEGSDRALGIFVSMLPLRLHLRQRSWLDLITQVFEAERELLAYRRFPFAEIQRMHGNSTLFESSFNFVHFHVYQEIERGSGVRIDGGQGFELLEVPLVTNFGVDPITSRLSLDLNFHLDVLSREQIEAATACYRRALELAAAEPEADPTTAVLSSAAETEWLLSAGQPAPQPLAPPVHGVHTLFSEQAARTPDAPALVFGRNEVLTYGELEQRSNQLASHLLSLGAGPEVRAGILLPRTPEAIVAILGVLKAGSAYLPLDPLQPAERLLYMVEDSGIALLITDEIGADRIATPPGLPLLVFLDSEASMIAARSATLPRQELDAENLAYIIYTSGSTGRPKGTMIAHRGLANLAATYARDFDIRPGDRLLQFSSLTFDASVAEILPALLIGAELHLPGPDRLPAGADLLALLQERRITHVTLPPSVLAGLPPGDLPALRLLTTAGEACPAELAERWAAVTRLINAYGPTEASVCTTMAEVAGDGTKPSIGRPIPGFRAMVVDSFQQPARVGVPGELWIGGIGLARGYLDKPGMTAAAFGPDPWSGRWSLPGERLYRTGDLARRLPDGQLDFLGRIDQQVKVRGFRIELGEIEACLLQQRSVRAAAVMARNDQPGDQRIVAYLVLGEGGEGENAAAAELAGERATELRENLRKSLPDHMLPATFVLLPELPLTPHGKLDRRALPAPASLRRSGEISHVPPRSPIEEQLAAIWAKLLDLEKVSVLDDFLTLGGHSLVAVQVIDEVREAFGVNLPLRTLYEEATVARLAVAVVQAQAEEADREALERALAELDGLSDEEAQETLARLNAPQEGARN